MAREPTVGSRGKKKRQAVSIALADNVAVRDGSHRVSVVREALEASRTKRDDKAKRDLESEALSERELVDAPVIRRARPYVPNRFADRPKVTTDIDPGTLSAFEHIAKQSGQSKAELLRGLIEDTVDPDGPAPVRRDIVTRKTQVVFFSKLFIAALEEALDYDPHRHHNQPPPPLRLDNQDYLADIKTLVTELKRLNENLEAASKVIAREKPKRTPKKRKDVEKSAIKVSRHVNTFLHKYASTLGTGAAMLTIGTAGALLQQLGVPFDLIAKAVHR